MIYIRWGIARLRDETEYIFNASDNLLLLGISLSFAYLGFWNGGPQMLHEFLSVE